MAAASGGTTLAKGRTELGGWGRGGTDQLRDGPGEVGHPRPVDTSVWMSRRVFSVLESTLCVRVEHSAPRADQPPSLAATASRTSQCAAEDMWSGPNPLLYFTSSFTTQIQTSFSAGALGTNALCSGISRVPAPFFPFFPPTYFL